MRAKLMLTLAATAAAMVFPPVIDAVRAEGQAALTGIVSSAAEGKMEGGVVTAHRPRSPGGGRRSTRGPPRPRRGGTAPPPPPLPRRGDRGSTPLQPTRPGPP